MTAGTAPIRARIVELQSLPRTAKAGVAVIGLGVAADAVVHSLGVVTAGTLAALVVQQHLAHVLVLLGMVLTLAGIVADGVRRREPDAVR